MYGKSLAFSVVWWSYGKSLAFSVLWWSRGKSLAFPVVWWSYRSLQALAARMRQKVHRKSSD